MFLQEMLLIVAIRKNVFALNKYCRIQWIFA